MYISHQGHSVLYLFVHYIPNVSLWHWPLML
jgi:hypothetical protein